VLQAVGAYLRLYVETEFWGSLRGAWG
jgi:hypothetical protein